MSESPEQRARHTIDALSGDCRRVGRGGKPVELSGSQEPGGFFVQSEKFCDSFRA